jgi:hypothetical protein
VKSIHQAAKLQSKTRHQGDETIKHRCRTRGDPTDHSEIQTSAATRPGRGRTI